MTNNNTTSTVIADHDFGTKLKNETCACRVHIKRFGTRKSLSADQKGKAANAFSADGDWLSASKRILDTKHPAFKAVTAVVNRARKLWGALTVPYPETGIRLIRTASIEMFDEQMQLFRSELEEACIEIDGVYAGMVEVARHDLGELFNAGDYPDNLLNMMELDWDFPSVEPPDYLKKLNPSLYKREEDRLRARMDEAVELAEEAFLGEFAKYVQHLGDKLGGGVDGKKKQFRDSSVDNIHDFIERFKQLNIGSNAELDGLVEECQAMVKGIDGKTLRSDTGVQDIVKDGMKKIGKTLDEMIVERPTRKLSFEE